MKLKAIYMILLALNICNGIFGMEEPDFYSEGALRWETIFKNLAKDIKNRNEYLKYSDDKGITYCQRQDRMSCSGKEGDRYWHANIVCGYLANDDYQKKAQAIYEFYEKKYEEQEKIQRPGSLTKSASKRGKTSAPEEADGAQKEDSDGAGGGE